MRKPNYSPTYQESSSSRRTWLHLTLDEGFQISHLHQARILLFILLPVVIFIGKKEGLLCRNFPSFVATILYFYLTCICLGKLVYFFFFFLPLTKSLFTKRKKKTSCFITKLPREWMNTGCSLGLLLFRSRDRSQKMMRNDSVEFQWLLHLPLPS